MGFGVHSVVATDTGCVWAWGGNGSGQLGVFEQNRRSGEDVDIGNQGRGDSTEKLADKGMPLDNTIDTLVPQKVQVHAALKQQTGPIFSLQMRLAPRVLSLATGGNFTVLIVEGGRRLFTFGANNVGQLGVGKTIARAPLEFSSMPQLVVLPLNSSPMSVAAGEDHALCIAENGALFAWGSNDHGQLGIEEVSNNKSLPDSTSQGRDFRPTPVHVRGYMGWNRARIIGCGAHHSLCVTIRDEVYAWGDNLAGQLGVGKWWVSSEYWTPTFVSAVSGLGVVQIDGGSHHTLFRCRDGSVYGAGLHTHKSKGAQEKSLVAVRLELGVDSAAAIDIACSASSSFVVTEQGALLARGDNSGNWMCLPETPTLGALTAPDYLTSFQQIFPDDTMAIPGQISRVSGHDSHLLVLTNHGAIFSAGRNSYGQRGQTVAGSSLPQSLTQVAIPVQKGRPILLPSSTAVDTPETADASHAQLDRRHSAFDFRTPARDQETVQLQGTIIRQHKDERASSTSRNLAGLIDQNSDARRTFRVFLPSAVLDFRKTVDIFPSTTVQEGYVTLAFSLSDVVEDIISAVISTQRMRGASYDYDLEYRTSIGRPLSHLLQVKNLESEQLRLVQAVDHMLDKQPETEPELKASAEAESKSRAPHEPALPSRHEDDRTFELPLIAIDSVVRKAETTIRQEDWTPERIAREIEQLRQGWADLDRERQRSSNALINSNNNEGDLIEFLSDDIIIGKSIGRGATGTVSRCMLKQHRGMFAVKQMRFDRNNAGNSEAFEREVSMMRRLRHPNLCNIVGIFRDTNMAMIVMDLADDSFQEVMQDRRERVRERSLDWWESDEIVKFSSDIATALAYLHTHGCAHRDLKPDNVLAIFRGLSVHKLVLTDFGLVTPTTGQSLHFGAFGTVAFMAPEMFRRTAGGPSGYRFFEVDIYALGLLFFELLSGCRVGFSGDLSKLQYDLLMDEQARNVIPAARAACIENDAALLEIQDIFIGCTSIQPNSRPSADEILERLSKLQS